MLIQASLVIFTGAMCLICLYGIAQPAPFMSIIERMLQGSGGIYTAVTIPVLFGGALIYSAGTSRFPLVVYLIGGLVLISAALLPVVGQQRIDALIERFRQLPANTFRIWLVGGFAFGAFLIYTLWR